MGVQEEDKCRRKGGEIQSSVGRKRLFPGVGIDFGDIFSPAAKVASIRLLLSVVATFYFEGEQVDVKTSFLHRDLEKEMYVKQPEGFVVKGKKELV